MPADPDWWRGAVIYQIYPRSFQDSNGDGIGDLGGIVQRLPHIAGLGADAVWISPFFTSPMKDFGYDVSDYCDVDPMFGSLADFDAVIAAAKALDLKVMIDLVLSHTSDAHPWFARSRGTGRMTRPTGMSGPIRSPMAHRPTTGCRFLADRPGPGMRGASSIICTTS